MAITTYKKEIAPNTFKTFYLVVAEGINKYTGKRVQKKSRGITSELKAERVYRELWSQCREEKPSDPMIKTWSELKYKYLDFFSSKIRSEQDPYGFSPKVFETKKSRFKHTEEWDSFHLDLITPQFVTQHLDNLERKGVSRSLTNHIQKEIKCSFSYAVDVGVYKANPLINLRNRKVPKRKKEALTHEEVDKLLLEAKKQDHEFFFIWLTTVATGLRRSELAGLKWTDIDFENRIAHIRRQFIPKEGIVPFPKDREERTVALPQFYVQTLKEYKVASKSEYVISVESKEWIGGQQAEVLRSFCRKIGIKEVTHHQLRATHITLALIDGVPLGIVKENVGHSKLSTTDEYFRSSGIQMKGQTDGLKIKVPTLKNATIRPLKGVG